MLEVESAGFECSCHLKICSWFTLKKWKLKYIPSRGNIEDIKTDVSTVVKQHHQYLQHFLSVLQISCVPQVDIPSAYLSDSPHSTKEIHNADPLLSLTCSEVEQVNLPVCLSSALVSFTSGKIHHKLMGMLFMWCLL